MIYNLILENITRHISLDQEEIKYFTSSLKQKKVSKKEFILKGEQTCKYINFVHSGILRAYYLDKDGKQSTIMFAVK